MPKLKLRIEADLCGPISVGTAGIVIVLRDALGLSLSDASAYVDRCVFDGETVEIDVASAELAARIADRIRARSRSAKIFVGVEG